MTGPAWLGGTFAGLMILIAAFSAARLIIWRLEGRDIEPDADALHVVMGVAMAGMLEPQLVLVPDTVWRPVFAVGAGWFAWQAVRGGRSRPHRGRCAYPAPHAVECGAMIYMLLPAGSVAVRSGAGLAMAGMGSPMANPALVLVLALFMLGYILWTTDRLTSQSRAGAHPAAHGLAGRLPATPGQAALGTRDTAGPATIASTCPEAGSPLAPRLAACCKVAMSIAMGYMLILML